MLLTIQTENKVALAQATKRKVRKTKRARAMNLQMENRELLEINNAGCFETRKWADILF